MGRKKYKATGCARFILVFLILIPVAYFGAKMISDGEGIPAVDNFIESIFNKSEETPKPIDEELPSREMDELQNENDRLKKRIEELERDAQ